MPVRIALTLVACLAGLFPGFRGAALRADYVTLRSGGEIRGEFIPEKKGSPASRDVAIRTLSGALVEVVRTEVRATARRRPLLEEYETRRRAAPETLAAHWELAEWCRANALSQQRKTHLEKVVEFDPEHVMAHRGLGHIRDSGRWTSPDDLMAARGYVKHRGKHLLPQQVDVIALQQLNTESEKRWYRQLKQWQTGLASEREDRSRAALAAIRGIDKPSAVPALVRALRSTPEEEYRLIFVEALCKIEGDRPVAPLAVRSVLDESAPVRDAAIAGVRRKGIDAAIPVYLKFLKDPLNVLVNRAAAALAQLGAESVVPQLIEALVTRHQYQMLLPEEDVMAFLDEQEGPVIALPADYVPPSQGTSQQLPQSSGGHSEMVETSVAKAEQNTAVLAALHLLTDQNFGYDMPAWRTWYNTRKNSLAAPGRKSKARP